MATDRVEVLRGSGSSLYGTNAVGGVSESRDSGWRRSTRRRRASRVRLARSGAGSRVSDRQRHEPAAGLLGGRPWMGNGGRRGRRRRGAKHGRSRRHAISNRSGHEHLGPVLRIVRSRTDATRVRRRSGFPAENIPDRTIVDAIAVAPDQMERFDDGQSVEVGGATFFPGRTIRMPNRRSSFQIDRASPGTAADVGAPVAGELPADAHGADASEWPAWTGVPESN